MIRPSGKAILHDQFGTFPVSAHYRPGWWWNFAACRAGCAPLSYWNTYFLTFTNARNSTFHLSTRRTRPNLGNYPIPIKVKGRYVACDRAESRFLITYGSAAGFAFACLG
ncbi:MAG: hypothetical protein H0W90_12240 [Actinobacteria bacterium]|nr:hypothetical protein [Actinomycetota bacterium]